MNDSDLSAALSAIHEDRMSLPAPPTLHRRAWAVPDQTSHQRGWLPTNFTARFLSLYGATKFVVAGVIVALFGGLLLAGVLTQPSDEQGPMVGASASADAELTDTSTAEPEPTDGPGSFRAAGTLSEPRARHTATLLADGRVLVVGGTESDGSTTHTAEIWDPATESFEPTGSLISGRSEHTATLLDDGRVLIVGGAGGGIQGLAEVWDPTTGSFEFSGALGPFDWHTATKLLDGRVLAVGQLGSYPPMGFVWNPADESAARVDVPPGIGTPGVGPQHTATLLPDGRILFILGREGFSGLIGNPASSAFEAVGRGWTHRREYAVTRLSDGRVLVTGGTHPPSHAELSSAQLWDSATGSFDPTGSLADVRRNHTSTLLPDGRVLVVGGGFGAAFASAEIWDPATSAFEPAAPLAEGRRHHTATRLLDGRVLVIGGDGGNGALASAEIWEPGDG